MIGTIFSGHLNFIFVLLYECKVPFSTWWEPCQSNTKISASETLALFNVKTGACLTSPARVWQTMDSSGASSQEGRECQTLIKASLLDLNYPPDLSNKQHNPNPTDTSSDFSPEQPGAVSHHPPGLMLVSKQTSTAP